jgi:hypothetical protein
MKPENESTVMPLTRKLLSIPLLLLLACLGCSRDNPKILPDQLNGFWVTDVPRYQDRFLEFDRVYVFIGVGSPQVPTLQMVDKVEAEPAGKETTYTIYSSDLQGNSYQMTLQFNPLNGGEIQLKSQRGIVWKRPTQGNAPPKP